MYIIFEDIYFEGDKHDTNPCSFESVGSVKVHHPMIR
jgi:hypothetical protein